MIVTLMTINMELLLCRLLWLLCK